MIMHQKKSAASVPAKNAGKKAEQKNENSDFDAAASAEKHSGQSGLTKKRKTEVSDAQAESQASASGKEAEPKASSETFEPLKISETGATIPEEAAEISATKTQAAQNASAGTQSVGTLQDNEALTEEASQTSKEKGKVSQISAMETQTVGTEATETQAAGSVESAEGAAREAGALTLRLNDVFSEGAAHAKTEKSGGVFGNGRFGEFLRKNIDYVLTAAILVISMLCVWAVHGCQPFGSKSAIYSDTRAQVLTFFEQFYDLFSGKSTFFYSNRFGKGMEIFSTMQYMFFNPFYFIVFLGGRNNIRLFITFAELFMLLFVALTFVWFSRKYFKKLSVTWRVIFALLFVFDGYISYEISFLSWIIYPGIALIVLDRFIEMLRGGKITGLILSLIWYVVTCYSVGTFTAIMLFILAVGYGIITMGKDERRGFMTKLFVVFSIAASASLVILFPSIIAVMSSFRSESLAVKLIAIENLSLKVKTSILLYDAAPMIMAVIYFIKCKKKDKFNIFLLFTVFILFVPVLFDSVMRMLCLGGYLGFQNRFYFLNEILIFCVAQKFTIEYTIKVKSEKNQKMFLWILGVLFFIYIAFIAVMTFWSFPGMGSAIKSPLHHKADVTIILLSIFAVIMILLGVTRLFGFMGVISKLAVRFFIAAVVIVSTLSQFLILGSASYTDVSREKEVKSLVQECGITEPVKFLTCSEDIFEENLRLGSGINFSAFSSLVSQGAWYSYQKIGYDLNIADVSVYCGTLLADVFMGIKYYISMTEQNHPYLRLVGSGDGCYLYENTLVGSGIVTVDSAFEFDDDLSPIDNYNRLCEFYGEGKLFETVDLDFEKSESDSKALVSVSYTAAEDCVVYIFGRYNLCYDKDENGEVFEVNQISVPHGCQDLGFVRAGETLSRTFKMDEYGLINQPKAYIMNYKSAMNLIDKLGGKDIRVKYNKDGYEFDGHLAENETMYISFPDIDGLNYTIDGEKIEVGNVFYKMVKIDGVSGSFHFKATYKYPNLKMWIVLFAVCAAIITIIALIYRKNKFMFAAKVISPLMIVLCAGLVMVFYGVGMIISLTWFFI